MTCREAAAAISAGLDGPLPTGTWLGLRAHTLLCRSCRRFEAQVAAIDAAAAALLAANGTGAGVGLPVDAKGRIKAAVDAEGR